MKFGSLLLGIILIIANYSVFGNISQDIPENIQIESSSADFYGKNITYHYSDLEKIRTKAGYLTSCPELESTRVLNVFPADGDVSDDPVHNQQNNGWILYPCNPTVILNAFPHLRLDAKKKIAGYYYQELIGGNVLLSVIDKNTNISFPDNLSELSVFDKKTKDERDIMSYIRGDKSPDSYIEASLLSREYPEISAFWHGIEWDTHSIIDDDRILQKDENNKNIFSKFPDISELNSPDWKWTEGKPLHYDPVVIFGNDTVQVQFYTYSGRHPQKIVRHTDVYTNNSYKPISEDIILATGKYGYQF
jgi:hypothetical protein